MYTEATQSLVAMLHLLDQISTCTCTSQACKTESLNSSSESILPSVLNKVIKPASVSSSHIIMAVAREPVLALKNIT